MLCTVIPRMPFNRSEGTAWQAGSFGSDTWSGEPPGDAACTPEDGGEVVCGEAGSAGELAAAVADEPVPADAPGLELLPQAQMSTHESGIAIAASRRRRRASPA